MSLTLPVLIALLTAAPFVAAYWIGWAVARVRQGRWLREARPWRSPSLALVEGEWLEAEWDAARLPAALPLVVIAAEWAAVDPPVLREWRLGRVDRGTGLEPLLHALWEKLPPAGRARTEPLLREALAARETAWSGAERGWNGQPYVLPAPLPKRRAPEEPLVEVVPDLTSAPAPGPLRGRRAAEEAEAWMLPLLLALQRQSPVRRVHPLAASAQEIPMLADLSGRVGSSVGARLGAGLGSILGPVGSYVGQYVGSMLGGQGARQLAGRARVPAAAEEIEAAERALIALGALVEDEAFDKAVRLPEASWLALGAVWERERKARRARLVERFWPSLDQALGEECLRQALGELHACRATAPLFRAAAGRAKPLARGGILLQNPWLAGALPEGPARISAARAALNHAALALRGR